MKKLMTILALATSLAVMAPTSVEARDHHRHHSSSHHHSSHRHHTTHHYYHSYPRYYNSYTYAPYGGGYYGDSYRERCLVGYDRYGYPIYSYRSPRYYGSRGYVRLGGIHIGF